MSHDPGEVLNAVRRLEQSLDEIRGRATDSAPVAPPVEVPVTDQAALVEDLEILVDLVGRSWRTTRQEIAALTAEVSELRRVAEEARAALRDVRFELRLVQGGGSQAPGDVA